MTLTILQAVEAAAYAWMQTRVPRLGMLVAQRDFAGMDRLFRRVALISTAVLLLGGTAFCGVVALLPELPWGLAHKLAARLAEPLPTVVLVAGLLMYHIVRCLGVYVYVHKRDPFLIPQAIASPCVGLAIWWGGKQLGIPGVAWGYLIAVTLVFLPLWTREWRRVRAEHLG